MGGFHGGHGGGGHGGFHGGGHSGGFHGGGHSGGFHGSYMGSSEGNYYPRRYYWERHQEGDENPVNLMGFSESIIMGVLLLLIGMLIFGFCFKFPTQARVYKVTESGQTYTEYLEYRYMDCTFYVEDSGYLSSHFVFDQDTQRYKTTYESPVSVNDYVDVYISMFTPANYSYGDDLDVFALNLFAGAALVIGIILFFFLAGWAMLGRIELNRLLKSIGDYNGDGVINEQDARDYQDPDFKRNGKRPEYKDGKKILRCPFCTNVVEVTDDTCPVCKAKLKMNEDKAKKLLKCPVCNAFVNAGDTSCPICGSKL